MQILTNLVDSLHLRLKLDYPIASSEIQESLSDWREYKGVGRVLRDFRKSIAIPGCGDFQLLPWGSFPYEFVLTNPEIAEIRIFNPDKFQNSSAINTGQIFLSFRSNWLFYNSDKIQAFIDSLTRWLVNSSLPSTCQALISTIDLAVDVAGYKPSLADSELFITRSRKSHAVFTDSKKDALEILNKFTHTPPPRERSDLEGGSPPSDNRGGSTDATPGDKPENRLSIGLSDFNRLQNLLTSASTSGAGELIMSGQNLETLYFGRFTSPVFCRIYDKDLSLDKQGKEFLREHWLQSGWNPSDPAFRVEFSLGGEFLQECSLTNPSTGEIEQDFRPLDKCLAAIPEIWQYLTSRWLRHVEPYEGSNRSRSPVSSWWSVVQSGWSSTKQLFRLSKRRSIDLKNLGAQIEGCLLTYASRLTANLGKFSFDCVASHFNKLFFEWFDSPQFLQRLDDRVRSLGFNHFNFHYDPDPDSPGFVLHDSIYSASVRSDQFKLYGSS